MFHKQQGHILESIPIQWAYKMHDMAEMPPP